MKRGISPQGVGTRRAGLLAATTSGIHSGIVSLCHRSVFLELDHPNDLVVEIPPSPRNRLRRG
eukprot:m.71184 g.71184  ORF g.71184 m.71184 type:complete len:63 (+) comp10055_c0_seq2:290-478(+)